MNNSKNTQFSFTVKGGWQYFKYILFGLLVTGFLSYTNYEILQRGETSTYLIIFECIMIIGVLFFIFFPVLKIELSENHFVIKRVFGIKSSIKYDDIEEMTISYGNNIGLKEQKFNEFIWIYKKNKNQAAVSIPRNRIVLKKDSTFLNSINFLSKKIPVTICITNIYKLCVDETIIDAKLEWSDFPSVFDKMK